MKQALSKLVSINSKVLHVRQG